MRITIDTENKTVEVHNAELGEVIKHVKKMLGKEWKEYTLLPPASEITYIPYYPTTYPPYTTPWWNSPSTTITTAGTPEACNTDNNYTTAFVVN